MKTEELESLKKEALKLDEKAYRYAKKIQKSLTIAKLNKLEKMEDEAHKVFSTYQKKLAIARG